MTILTFPTIRRPSEVSWRLRALTQTHESPLDGTTQTLRMPGARWEASVVWPTLSDPDRRILEAFIAQLNGRAGRFFFSPPHVWRRATGGWSGPAPYVSGPGQTGTLLVTGGWLPSADAMRAGDFFSVVDLQGRPNLFTVTADATANGSGFATLAIAPPIRRLMADGAFLTLSNPVGIFRLASDDVSVATRPPWFGSVSIDIEEALR